MIVNNLDKFTETVHSLYFSRTIPEAYFQPNRTTLMEFFFGKTVHGI